MFAEVENNPFKQRRSGSRWIILTLVIAIILFLVIFISFSAMSSFDASPLAKKQIGVINIEGVIIDSKDIVEWTEKLEKDNNITAVLVRVNSPGGAVTPSQEIFYALERLAAKKPMVASMGTLAASGGYMVCLPATHIVAMPSTLTGSIGTRMDLSNLSGLMGKIGIANETLASGEMKDAGSPYRPLSEKDRAYFMGMLQDMQDQFLESVVSHRKLSEAEAKLVSDGRAFTGRQAKEYKLVDSLGDKQDAVNLLQNMSGSVEILPLKEGPPKKTNFMEKMFESVLTAKRNVELGLSRHSAFFYY